MRRFLRDWDVFLLIMLTGLLTGLITFMATDSHPAACRHAVAVHAPHVPLKWVCSHP